MSKATNEKKTVLIQVTFLKKTQSAWILFAIPGYLAKPHIIYSVFKFLLQEAYHPGLGKEYATL